LIPIQGHGRTAIVASVNEPNTSSTPAEQEELLDFEEYAKRTVYFESGGTSGSVKFPISVAALKFRDDPVPNWLGRTEIGQMVQVRPVTDPGKGETFLGVYVGDFPVGCCAVYDKENNALCVQPKRGNPAIFIPSLKRVVRGYESWWGPIETEEQLRKITDDDIQNIWYVKALKALGEQDEKATSED